jgi:DNA gyrase/topoisomerase IV subunit A
MATNIPPHNLRELIDATIALIDDPDLTAVDLMRYLPAPDFPTGGLILGNQGAYDAYTTGRGSIKVRAVCTSRSPSGVATASASSSPRSPTWSTRPTSPRRSPSSSTPR